MASHHPVGPFRERYYKQLSILELSFNSRRLKVHDASSAAGPSLPLTQFSLGLRGLNGFEPL
jgi:hypothetical protein